MNAIINPKKAGGVIAPTPVVFPKMYFQKRG